VKFSKFRLGLGFDWTLYIIPFLLCVFGIVIIYSIDYGVKDNIAYDQILYTIVGFVIAIALSLFVYKILKGMYLIIYLSGLFLLILVMLVGSTTFGATRWIDLYFFKLQPSELFKIINLIILAKLFSDWEVISFKKFLAAAGLVLLPLVMILMQPDLGTASVIFVSFLAILFMSKIKKIYIVIGLAVLIALSPIGWHFLRDYQKNRVVAFINPATDPQGAGYNVSQAKIAVGSGGLLGRGIGKGTQSQLNFLPVAHTDFIFAGTAEATGFVGSSFLIILIFILIIRVYNIAATARDDFGMYLAGGIGTIFLFQTLVNAGMNLGIMPVTGIPLPFVSYGGSSMLTNMAALGILQSIYLRHKVINF